ncbi:hypothetical protein L249_1546 [Ophiocordyceps polyrhachis-furcata BCC 54312]|uniref:INO80 complex subunit Ies4 n=1 Tax=Ophiocordyceps polyrhachis-furcata BCC 54312 TaxID=1330021 RepID=A0A367L403_9HYPO|nr:hypothetical protein L249_1546 [Ophiocordyceps polyrhachis-furcata BCC 54312]
MAPAGKTADTRRKSGTKPSLFITLTISPDRLRCIVSPESVSTKESSRSKDVEQSSPSASTHSNSVTQPVENASDSNAPTPAADGTPAPSVMGPPTDGPKKKGTKRSAPAANGSVEGVAKPRAKPGPKKKPRLDDGTIDHAGPGGRTAGTHKLGPKANQGAINAGLRALDRSGKPCRKWCRGGFVLKSFTGVVWEVSRWRAPTKKDVELVTDDSNAPSADNSSSKENKENGAEANHSGSSGGDVDMGSVNSVHASSPAPMAVSAAS